MNGIDPIARINRVLNQTAVPHEMDEARIEALLVDLDHRRIPRDEPFWFTTARITELALLCAGHYADNCEFSAAGDLLLNPRRICVNVTPHRQMFIKARHGRVSDQLAALPCAEDARPISPRQADCNVVTPALLPFLYRRLRNSGIFDMAYMDDVAARMQHIADTIAFLAAYQTFSNEALHRKLATAGEDERAFVTAHLCRFTRGHFDRLGRQIEMKGPPPATGPVRGRNYALHTVSERTTSAST